MRIFGFRLKAAGTDSGTEKIRRPKKAAGIRRKLFIRMICITVVLGVVLTVLNGALLYTNMTRSMQQQVTGIAVAYNDSVKNAIQNYKMAVKSVAADPEITNSEKKSQWKIKAGLLAQKYGFSSAGIADADGRTLDGQDISKSSFFQDALFGQTSFSSTEKNSDGSLGLYIASKITNGTGYDGIVYACLPVSNFNQIITSLQIGNSGYGFLVDSSGKIIAHKNQQYVLSETNYIEKAQEDPSFQEAAGLVKDMTAQKVGNRYVTIDGSLKYVFYTPVTDTDWSLCIVADVHEMMTGFYQSLWVIAITMLIFLAITAVVSVRTANRFAGPIFSLMKRMEDLEKGDLHSPVPEIRTRDEIEKFSLVFLSTIHSLNQYIGEITSVLGAMAQGDFTAAAVQDYKGDFSAIKTALDSICLSMNDTFRDIHSMAAQVSQESEHVAGVSRSLAAEAANQNQVVQGLSDSVSYITQQADKSAASAEEAGQISQQAVQDISQGTSQMDRMLSAMDRISQSSAEIEKIIKTIQTISFQTNLLALNAAVEAARAEKAGRGFAVVAGEVRNLANQSAGAAKNTAQLIGGSSSSVEAGRTIAEETAHYLRSVIDKVQQMNGLLQTISISARDQAETVQTIQESVRRLSASERTNSVTAQESAEASSELSELSKHLNRTLLQYRFNKKAEEERKKSAVKE